MEKIISPEERMRRAEEIYYRRKAQGVRLSTSSVNMGKNNKISLGKKMSIQIVICIIIYMCFWMIKGYNNVFSENIVNQTKMILSYDINFQNLYNQFMEYFSNNFNNIIKIDSNSQNDNNDEVNKDENNEQNDNGETDNIDNTENNENNVNNSDEQNINQDNDNTQNEDNQNLGMGGGSDIVGENTTENKTQMELDAEYIKGNYSLIVPVQGIITSGFGDREPTEIISAFHQGIDIGAVTGTSIYASMEGTVVAASYAGDYGNHIKIQNGEVLTVYAHCSKLNVSVGDYVKQGQEIGKVGATGKVTGSHLHFEIRRDDRYVNPDLILNF